MASRFVFSQVSRHCFAHRPRHLNWLECSSIAPPQSGQRQFTMADSTFSFDRFELSGHIEFPQSTEISSVSTPITLARAACARRYLLAIAVTTVAILTFSPDTLPHR